MSVSCCAPSSPTTTAAERASRRRAHRHGATLAFLLALAAGLGARELGAQTPAPATPGSRAGDSLVTVRVRVIGDSAPVASATVRAGRIGGRTGENGEVSLRLPAGDALLVTSRLGHRADSTRLTLRAGADTTVIVRLGGGEAELERVVVSATRSERRVEDVPLRVEVIDEEEIAEKVAMTPGDIGMMLNETSGLRVQTTSPSLGGANVRVQGLRGRYTLILTDGLPLYGQAGGLGLLQIPPVDLGRVEVIKGTSSALYGSAALGGVVNLLSRRSGEEATRDLVLNQSSRGGSDAVLFASAPLGAHWGGTLLVGGHRQRQNDLDGDGWTDMPGYERVVLRPRLFREGERGRSMFVTAGFTGEDRTGGTLEGRVAPNGAPFVEGLRTTRADVGVLARWLGGEAGPFRGAIFTARGSAMLQRHAHEFGAVREDDRHETAFAEASVALPRTAATWVLGAAVQRDAYRAGALRGFDYAFVVPGAFAQLDVDAARWLALSGSVRVDRHDVYGTFVNPRLSALVRGPVEGALAEWTLRLSGGEGSFAPTPFTEETEVTGLLPLLPLSGVVAERARSASIDVGGPLTLPFGRVELNGTVFGSRIDRALQVRAAAGTTPAGASRIALVNAPLDTRTWGGELLARLLADPVRVTATYTQLRAREWDPDASAASTGGSATRRDVPLTPRHAFGVVTSVEEEDAYRVGLEVYHTGRQALADDPFRSASVPYTVVGLLAERVVVTPLGRARFFVNGENLGNVRQTRQDRLVLPARGEGGRWTTDVWSVLEGRVVNGGVRLAF